MRDPGNEVKPHQPKLVFIQSSSILVDLEFGDVGFCEGRITGKLNSHMTLGRNLTPAIPVLC